MKVKTKNKVIVFLLLALSVGVVFHRYKDIKVKDISSIKINFEDVERIHIEKSHKKDSRWTFEHEEIYIQDKEAIEYIIHEVGNLKIRAFQSESNHILNYHPDRAAYHITFYTDREMENITINGGFMQASFLKRDRREVMSKINYEVLDKYFIEKNKADIAN